MTLVFWGVFLASGIMLGLPVKRFWAVGWALTAVLAACGVTRQCGLAFRHEWRFLAFAASLPACLMAPYFWHGVGSYLGSPAPDGWSYVAYGQYLWEYPRGTEGGLAPLHQFAAYLNGTRFIASALLGFLSPIVATAGDTQPAAGYLLAWGFFLYSSTCAFVGRVKGLQKAELVGYAALTVFSVWMVRMLWANNYDNVLAMCFLPACVGLVEVIDPRDPRWGIPLACLVAGSLYTYPEIAPFVLGGLCLCLAQRISAERALAGRWAILLLVSAGVAGGLVWPFARFLLAFFHKQATVAFAAHGSRPGEGMAPQLLRPQDFPWTFWGLPAKQLVPAVLAPVLNVLGGLGLLQLWRRKQWGVALTVTVLFGSTLVMAFVLGYDYGAYKLILISWWGVCLAVALGAQKVVARMGATPLRQRELRMGLGGLLLLVLFFTVRAVAGFDRTLAPKTVHPFRQVREIGRFARGNPVAVAVDEPLANEWAVYFLRDLSVYLVAYRFYMAVSSIVPLMDRAKPIRLADVRYILADRGSLVRLPPESRPLWSGGAYSLWQLPREDWIFGGVVRNDNGVENWDGESGLWLGQGSTEIRLLSSRAGTVVLAGYFSRGPSLPGKADREILVQPEHGSERIMRITADAPQSISIPVQAGQTRVMLRALDKPTLTVLPNGDHRPLLVGIRGLKILALQEAIAAR
jgi:hypothetical protein